MRYRANPVEVKALIIVSVGEIESDGTMRAALQDGQNTRLSKAMLARFIPQAGDYWVVQKDGYVYINPKDVFERKYSPIPD